MKIAIIGGGWVGCVAAWHLSKLGYDVTIYEKNDDIFKGESGKFALRLHIGPHYPDSENTRKSCQEGLKDFIQTFPDLYIPHAYSIYALGTEDANGRHPTIDAAEFEAICREMGFISEIDPKKWGYENLVNAFNVDEPSAAVGERLREGMRKRLEEVGVKIICNCKVENIQEIIQSENRKFKINNGEAFDRVVNATYYQDLLPKDPLPDGIETVYQPCLTLRYRDTKAEKDPFSFTVMSGMFPCLMPREDHITIEGDTVYREYTLYHAKYTILDSCETPLEAQLILDNLQNDKTKYDAFIEKYKPLFEAEIKKFYPGFEGRFEFVGTNTGIAAKFRTKKNFRSAVTFMKDGIIYVFSGKVNNVLDSAYEIKRLITTAPEHLTCEQGYLYLPDGEFARSRHEIVEKTYDPFNAANLHTLRDFFKLPSSPEQLSGPAP